MTVADALATALRDWGVRFVFGVSGANIEPFHDAVLRVGAGGALDAVLARGEAGAGFMADGRARVHRTLGVVCATSGGGMTNLVPAVAESYAESVPVLAIVGQPPTTLEGRGAFQDSSGTGRTVDARAMWAALTKATLRVERGRDLWAALIRAVTAALSGRPGPAVLLVPRDVWFEAAGPAPRGLPATLDELAIPVEPNPGAVDALFAALTQARAPVAILGPGVERSGAREAVRAFLEDAGIPAATTMSSPAAFPDDPSRWLGMVGAAGHPSAHAWIGAHADVVVALGTGLGALTRGPIEAALARADVHVVDLEPERVRAFLPHARCVSGDVGRVVARLRTRLAEEPFHADPPEVQPPTLHAPEPAGLPRRFPRGGLTASRAVAVLQEFLPCAGHLLFDAGDCAATALHGLRVPDGVTATIALGMGGMGYAVAAAVGAQLGSPEGARTVVVCGDGAFLMTGFEVHTAVALGLPIAFVVFDNRMHGMCAVRQRLFFDGRVVAAEYPAVDFATVARGLGPPDRVATALVEDEAGLAEALRGWWRGPPIPIVIDVRIAEEEVPPFTPFRAAR
ncbi:MAG: thiamine pyrophosphate-binding protein [Myxococcota bacterium]